MTWLITGGAGYIGGHVVRAFREAGVDVVVLDDLSAGVRARVPAEVRFYEGSVLDEPLLDEVFSTHRFAGVVHMAGKKSVPESVAEPELYQRINAGGTKTVVAACLRHGVPYLVFSSTAAVYGIVESSEPISEDAPVAPINPYGQTKLDAERAIHDATLTGSLGAIAFRYFNVGGAATPELEDLHGENLIPIVRRAIANDASFQVFGTNLPTRDGTCIRDYIHVQDLADAHLAAAQYLEANGGSEFEVINLGTGSGSTVLEVIAAVSAAEGKQAQWTAARPRAGDPVASTCDATRAGVMLGWHATRTLDQIAARAQ